MVASANAGVTKSIFANFGGTLLLSNSSVVEKSAQRLALEALVIFNVGRRFIDLWKVVQDNFFKKKCIVTLYDL